MDLKVGDAVYVRSDKPHNAIWSKAWLLHVGSMLELGYVAPLGISTAPHFHPLGGPIHDPGRPRLLSELVRLTDITHIAKYEKDDTMPDVIRREIAIRELQHAGNHD